MYRKLIPALLTATIALTAQQCDGGKGPATKASYAGDGVTMFVGNDGRACSGNTQFCAQEGNGKLKFGKTYKATPRDSVDKQNCQWSVYTINADGKVTVQKKGRYPAKINVERPTRVHVFLKSEDCGEWK